MPAPDRRILDAFRDRLLSAINRSPLLKVSPAKTGRLLDCSRLETLKENLGKQVLKAVVGKNERPVSVDLPWRLILGTDPALTEPNEETLFKSDEEPRARRIAIEQKLLQFDVSATTEDELEDLAWEVLPKHLHNLANGFQRLPVVNCEAALDTIQGLKELRPNQKPRFFNSAHLGYFRWQNEAILEDLDALKDMTECHAPAAR